MMDFLKAHGTWVPLKDDKEALQDARFNDAVSYILIIPEGFQEPCRAKNCEASGKYDAGFRLRLSDE